jgi:hypothetical protein
VDLTPNGRLDANERDLELVDGRWGVLRGHKGIVPHFSINEANPKETSRDPMSNEAGAGARLYVPFAGGAPTVLTP